MINLERHIVATRYDGMTRTCCYTVEQDGKRWTVEIPLHELDAHRGPGHKERRRAHLLNKLLVAMQGPHDGAHDDGQPA